MFSVLRNRFGIPGVISVIALIFALTGSAFAAKYIITSTSQIKPSVLKKLKGPKGPKGATGPAGPAGPAGAAGAVGKEGPAGKEGPQGEPGEPGEDGQDGQNGSPWTVGNVLPEGAMETGDWAVNGKFSAFNRVFAPISFTIPLSIADAAVIGEEEEPTGSGVFPNIHVLAVGEGETTECPGTVSNPEAVPGNLCIYSTARAGYLSTPGVFEAEQAAGNAEFQGVDTSGAVIMGLRENNGEGLVTGVGSWAVTAPEA